MHCHLFTNLFSLGYHAQLVEHFYQSLANTGGITLHIRKLDGRNSHHIIEASFKAFARALRQVLKNKIGDSEGSLQLLSFSRKKIVLFLVECVSCSGC